MNRAHTLSLVCQILSQISNFHVIERNNSLQITLKYKHHLPSYLSQPFFIWNHSLRIVPQKVCTISGQIFENPKRPTSKIFQIIIRPTSKASQKSEISTSELWKSCKDQVLDIFWKRAQKVGKFSICLSKILVAN